MSALPFKRPTDTITLTVLIEGTQLPVTVAILGAETVWQANRVPLARLRIGDGDPAKGEFAHSNGDLFVPGKKIVLKAGYHGETDPVFSGVILGQRLMTRRGASWLEVECRDPVFAMTLTRRNRYFEDSTDSAVVETLVSEYQGAGVSQGEVASTSTRHPQLMQHQASDWDFMMARLDAAGQLCFVDGGRVSTVKPKLDAAPLATVGYGADVLEFDAEIDSRTQTAAVHAQAWDAAEQTLLDSAGADPGWAGNGNLDGGKLSAASQHKEDILWHGGSLAGDALQEWADAAFLRARLAAARGRVRFKGIAAVKPGVVLELARFSDRFNGKVYVTGVRHEFGGGNWTTDAEFGLSREVHAARMPMTQLPAAGIAAGVHGLQVGVVSAIADDPAMEHRVRVKLPIAGMDEDGVWARVATMDAGKGDSGKPRGTFFRPEQGDEVVLGFFEADPSQPVILGMLHSSAKAPPAEPTQENHVKAYVSRSGIALRFDDEKKSVTLDTPGKNKLVLNDDEGGIVLEDQNGNRIRMDQDGITLESARKAINIKAKTDLKSEAMNVEFKAQTGFKANANAQAEVKSSGPLTLKGSIVMIN
jgi:Rhs element Vgr protein